MLNFISAIINCVTERIAMTEVILATTQGLSLILAIVVLGIRINIRKVNLNNKGNNKEEEANV